jgi:hypothetical protein
MGCHTGAAVIDIQLECMIVYNEDRDTEPFHSEGMKVIAEDI